MSADFREKFDRTTKALMSVGIDREHIRERMGKALEHAMVFSHGLIQRTFEQSHYDEFTNFPTDVIDPTGYDPQHAMHAGLISTLGHYLDWDPDVAEVLCVEILSECNMHDAAARVEKLFREMNKVDDNETRER